MDPIGFAFENFDADRRLARQGRRVRHRPSGELPDGQKFEGPAELKDDPEGQEGVVCPLAGRRRC